MNKILLVTLGFICLSHGINWVCLDNDICSHNYSASHTTNSSKCKQNFYEKKGFGSSKGDYGYDMTDKMLGSGNYGGGSSWAQPVSDMYQEYVKQPLHHLKNKMTGQGEFDESYYERPSMGGRRSRDSSLSDWFGGSESSWKPSMMGGRSGRSGSGLGSYFGLGEGYTGDSEGDLRRRWHSGSLLGQFNPVVDLAEMTDRYHILLELPGVKTGDVNIDINKNMITITGKKSQTLSESNDLSWIREERLFGNFRRQFNLDYDVDPNKAKAELKNGVLEIEVPKLMSQSSKRISVKS
jgi:HSP20 family protein